MKQKKLFSKLRRSLSPIHDRSGFTIFETMCALFVLLLCVSLLSFAFTQYQNIRQQTFNDRQLEWHLFLNQFEYSIKDLVFAESNSRRAVFEKRDVNRNRTDQYIYERNLTTLRKTSWNGGHQPMLMETRSVSFSLNGSFLQIDTTFLNDETYSAQVNISNNLAEEAYE